MYVVRLDWGKNVWLVHYFLLITQIVVKIPLLPISVLSPLSISLHLPMFVFFSIGLITFSPFRQKGKLGKTIIRPHIYHISPTFPINQGPKVSSSAVLDEWFENCRNLACVIMSHSLCKPIAIWLDDLKKKKKKSSLCTIQKWIENLKQFIWLSFVTRKAQFVKTHWTFEKK